MSEGFFLYFRCDYRNRNSLIEISKYDSQDEAEEAAMYHFDRLLCDLRKEDFVRQRIGLRNALKSNEIFICYEGPSYDPNIRAIITISPCGPSGVCCVELEQLEPI